MSLGFYSWHFSLQSIQAGSGAHPMCCPLDTIAVSSGIEGAGLEANHSPSSMNERIYAPSVSYAFMM
jgi:hypothetical protein